MSTSSQSRPAAPAGRDDQAFPELTDDQLERIQSFGQVESLAKGTEVFWRGQRQADFFVLLEGSIEVFDYNCDGETQVFTTHRARQFTGEIDLFSDRKVLVGGRTGEDSRVVRLNRSQFRDLLEAEPDIGDIVMRAFILRRLGILEHDLGSALLIGKKSDPEKIRIQRFLRRNGYPVQSIDVDEHPESEQLLAKHDLTLSDLPTLMCHGEKALSRPTLMEVAETVGLVEWPDADRVYDLAVVGAGPGGMAAAVYASSEGLSTVLLERDAPGGQAGTSSKIENYLGFPNGLSGQELAGRAQIQAQKFGATLALPMDVQSIEGTRPPYQLKLAEHTPISCRSIVIASGATYRTLDLENYEKFEGRGIHYAATAIEAGLCHGEEVIVVGGGNSAGQAAVYLAGRAKHVHMLVRGEGLAASMSEYLIRRIDASDSITLHCQTAIVRLDGDDSLQHVTWRNRETGEESTHPICHVFTMIGAVPNTKWLGDCVLQDEKGFVCTGQPVADSDEWPLERAPEPFETTLPGVFAIGDVRATSVKRVASAVGEGSICVQFVHRTLAAEKA